MYHSRSLSILLAAILMAVASFPVSAQAAPAANAEPNVVPAVQQWTGGSGKLTIATSLVIQIHTADQAQLADVASQLQSDLKTMGSGNCTIKTADQPTAGAIFLTLALQGQSLPHSNEAYSMVISNQATISAATPIGIFYGTRTLLQMLQQHKDGQLPVGTIVDYPNYAGRMLMLDVGRKPFPVATLKDFMRIMAWYKMNELHLHLSDESRGDRYAAFRIESKKFPGLAAKDLFYTWEDLRDLQDFAKVRAITITPEIDMPGHARCLVNYWPQLAHPKLGKSSLDVTNPQTAETMKSLLDEIIPLFDAPDFHIGTDEYRMSGLNKDEQQKAGEAFRQFINTMNAFVRCKGKNCRIWSGYENMPGHTVPDPSVVIDMWVTHDAKALIAQGHKVINSSDGSTYIVPGAHYYGVSNSGIYNNWEPWKISGDPAKNPAKNDPHLLGGKLHIWNDQGPAGYTLTEIADAALPSIQAFSEKLWGRKASDKYAAFVERTAMTIPIPGITVLDRMAVENHDGIVLDLPMVQVLDDVQASIPLPLAKAARADLEYPWTLSMDVCKASDTGQRSVILGSDLVEICADYARKEEKLSKDSAGNKIKTTETTHGLGLVRAAGAFGKDPADSIKTDQVSRVCGPQLPLDKWTTITIIAERGRTSVYVDGNKTGETNNQMVCPLRHLGSLTGQSFVGKVKNLIVWNRLIPVAQVMEHKVHGNPVEIGSVTPYPGEIEEAKRFPNGHVYRIAGHFEPTDAVPPGAIIGAWKVDAQGKIVGDFIRSPNYDPKRWPAKQ